MRRNVSRGSGRGLSDIAAVFAGIGDAATMLRFFGEIFTPAERNNIGLRWQLMKMLARGVPQRTIARRLGVSLCKITRGAKILRQRNSVSKNVLRRTAEN